MPIYEYVCNKCGHNFEELVFGGKNPLCPKCGLADTNKMISRPTLHMPAPSRVGRAAVPPAGGGGGCGSCTSKNCASCGS